MTSTTDPRPAFPTPPRPWRASCLMATLLLSTGCATTALLSPVPCSRVALEPAPPWTASAAWRGNEGALVLVDPGSRSLATYGRDGRRQSEVRLETAELDYSEPMRFESAEDGYVLIDKTRILKLDDNLALNQLERPFDSLREHGFLSGTFNDALVHRGHLYGYADFVQAGEATDDGAEDASTEDASTEDGGTWRRGFVDLDLAHQELKLIHELPVEAEGGEYANYYFYDRRPAVAELGGKLYVPRFTEPWSVHRITRRGLRQITAGDALEDERAHALQTWNDRLYVLTSRVLPDPEAVQQPTAPEPLASNSRRALIELQHARPAGQGLRQWFLDEIDPKGGEPRRLPLPTTAERVRLLPGKGYWTAIEESSAPNLGQGNDRTTFLFLPSSEILTGAFSCQTES